MGEKGTLYHLAKLAGIMLGLLAIQEQALAKPDNLILIPAILAASIIGYYESRDSLAIIIAASSEKAYLVAGEVIASGIFATAIVIALVRAARYLSLGGDIILLSALAAMFLALVIMAVRNGLAGKGGGDD